MKLLVGSRIQAKLIEEVQTDHWIVSFRGHLIQVKNSTEIRFKEGLILNLQVTREQPLQLKVLSSAKHKSNKLDLRV